MGYSDQLCIESKNLQEAAVVPPYIAFAVRPNPGFWEFVKVNSEDLHVDAINASEYLKFKEMIFDQNWYKLYFFSL